MSSIVLTMDTPLSTERLSIKIRRRSLGDGCGGGTITVGIDWRKESLGFDECECECFSFVLKPPSLRTIYNCKFSISGYIFVYNERIYK